MLPVANIKNENVTINDVARLAGVSKRTVSRVLNGSDKVGAKTKEAITKLIAELNYVPNTQARGLASRRSYLIGLIYDTPTLFITDAQSGVLSICSKLGYELVVHHCDMSSVNMASDVEQFVKRSKVDGIIALPPVSLDNDLAARLKQMDCPYVRYTADESCDDPSSLVVTDYLSAVGDLARHLIDFGHTRMGFITGPKGDVTSQKRQDVFSDELTKVGLKLPKSLIAQGEFTYESGVKAGEKLLNLKQRPTAIFAANDEMAVGVMNVAHDMGIKVPEQLSVVGFDGTRLASHFIPALTTVKRPTREMAVLASKKLIHKINHQHGQPGSRAEEQLFVTPVFEPRKSTGPCPKI